MHYRSLVPLFQLVGIAGGFNRHCNIQRRMELLRHVLCRGQYSDNIGHISGFLLTRHVGLCEAPPPPVLEEKEKVEEESMAPLGRHHHPICESCRSWLIHGLCVTYPLPSFALFVCLFDSLYLVICILLCICLSTVYVYLPPFLIHYLHPSLATSLSLPPPLSLSIHLS